MAENTGKMDLQALKSALALRSDILEGIQIPNKPQQDTQYRDSQVALQKKADELHEQLQSLQREVAEIRKEKAKPPDPLNPSLDILSAKYKHLAADLALKKEGSQSESLPGISRTQIEQSEFTKEDLKNNVRELQLLREFVSAKGKVLQQDEESEIQLNEKLQQVREELQAKLNVAVQAEEQGNDANIKLRELEQKKAKVISYTKKLMKQLAAFTDEHFPEPSEEIISMVQKQKPDQRMSSITPNYTSIQKILEDLMNLCMERPHDPYISLDDTHWPAYIELLLRCGIAVRHPQEYYRIKLTPFHL